MKVLIAGAGVIGLSTAWRLAVAGAHVHLIDPRPPGHGATLASLGALWPAGPLVPGPLQTLHRRSLEQFSAFAADLSRNSGLPVSYRRLGRMEILNSAKAAAGALQEAAAAPAAMNVIDFSAAKSLNPGLAAFPYAALHCRMTAQVNVHELVAALVRACEVAGVMFHRTFVTGLDAGPNRIRAVRTAGKAMEADAYIIAAGAWTSQLSPLLATLAPIVPAKGQGVSVPMPRSRTLTTIVKAGTVYLVPWDAEILVGSTTEPEAHFDETPTALARRQLLAGAAAIVPELEGSTVLRHWAGLRPCNSEKLHPPIMGPHPAFPNLFFCTGHYKTGIGMSPLVSEVMARWVLSGKISPEFAPFLPGPFTAAPSPADS